MGKLSFDLLIMVIIFFHHGGPAHHGHLNPLNKDLLIMVIGIH